MQFVPPLLGDPRVSSGFGPRRAPVPGASTMHNGIDYAVPVGTQVYASAPGTVARMGFQEGGGGNYVVLDHGDGYETKYLHLDQLPALQVGDQVGAGAPLAMSGNTGIGTGAHLDFRIKGPGGYVDPQTAFNGILTPSEAPMRPTISASNVPGLLAPPAEEQEMPGMNAFNAAALAFNSLRSNPDPRLTAAIYRGHEQDKARVERANAEAKQGQQQNATIAFLQKHNPMLAEAVASGLDPRTALAMMDSPNETTALQNNFEYARQQGYQGSFTDFMGLTRGGTNVTVNTGAESSQWGDPPKDHVWATDANNSVLTRETELPDGRLALSPIAIPMAGGPTDTTEADAAKAQSQMRTAGIVSEDIGRAQDLLANHSWKSPIAGFVGSFVSAVPGTPAYDFSELTTTIRANIGFDRLQKMRESNPTGGALGNVTVQEIARLEAVLGSIDQGQSPQQLAENLKRLDDVYADIIDEVYRSGDPSALGLPPRETTGRDRRQNRTGARNDDLNADELRWLSGG